MAKNVVTRTVRVGNRKFTMRGGIPLRTIVKEASKMVKARIRAITAEARELLLDRLYAAPSDYTPTVPRPPKLGVGSELRVDRKPFEHEPLSKDVLHRKLEAGQDPRPMIATGEYTYSIEVGEEETHWGTRFYVRPKDEMHSHSGNSPISLRDLALIHEYGSASRGIPARPHWRPVMHDVAKMVRKLGPDLRARTLRLALRLMK